jgi:uncharacterized membrane protein
MKKVNELKKINNRTMKKNLSLAVFLVCTVCLSAQDVATIGGVKYYLDSANSHATVMVQTSALSGDIVIAEKVSYNKKEYTVTKLEGGAFSGQKIAAVSLPNSITSLGENCFNGCDQLTSINIPTGITSLEDNCFNGCASLTSMTIPQGVTSLGNNCFSGCSSLSGITIPDGVASFGEYCFSGCSVLTNITIPTSVSSLGKYCFDRCSRLASITIPDGVTSLEDGCFFSCSNLTSVAIPHSVTSLGYSCFDGCSSLTGIIIPDGVTSMEDGCFSRCSHLESISIPGSVTYLGESFFNSCTSLTSVIIPEGISSFGDYFFYKCSSLTGITIPKSVTSLGSNCFGKCTSMTSFDVPEGVTSLGSECFSGCTDLTKVECHWKKIDGVTAENDIFDGVFSEAKLYVPTGTIAIYQAKAPWNKIKYIEETSTPEEPKQCAIPTITYNDKKLNFSSTTTGAKYHYIITDEDIKSEACSEDGNVSLTAAYSITVYASAEGYTNSKNATATLYFINANLKDATSISSVVQRGIAVQSNDGFVTVSGLSTHEKVSIYNVSGVQLGITKAENGIAAFSVNPAEKIVIVRIGQDTIKVTL